MEKKLYLFLHLMLKISWKSDKEWLQEKVLKINGFIWNTKKYIGKYLSGEILLARECNRIIQSIIPILYKICHYHISEFNLVIQYKQCFIYRTTFYVKNYTCISDLIKSFSPNINRKFYCYKT